MKEIEKALGLIVKHEKMEDYERSLSALKRSLEDTVARIKDYPDRKYTGWFILLKEDKSEESGFKFLQIFNPYKTDDDNYEEEWDLAIPIPTMESAPEFMGW